MWRKYLEREDSRIGGRCMTGGKPCFPNCFCLNSMKSPKNQGTHFLPGVQETEAGAMGRETLCGRPCVPCLLLKQPVSISLPDLFVGQLKSSLTCTDCGYCSTVFDPFWDLSLPIAKVCTLLPLF